MTNILKSILSVLLLLSFPMGANSATYSSVSVSSKYSDPWAAVTIRLKNLKIDGDSTARDVAFELHSNKSYYNKTYIQFNGQTFGYGKIPIDMTYKKRGDFYFHASGGDPVSIRQIRSILPAEEKLIFRGVCDFVKDRNNAQMIFDEAIKNSYGAGKKHWERFRSRMVNDTVNVGRACASKLGGQKVTFLQSNNSLAKSVCGYNFSEGKSASDLKSIQRGLAKRNLYNGGIDGKFGKGSCSALTKWAKCENVGSKVLSDGALSKLIKTNPSARELACYGKTTDNVAKLTFSDFQLRPVDGRSEGRDIVGSWITLRNVKIDGNPGAKKTIWFEILGRFPSQRMEMIGFSSKRTFENMPEYIGEKFGNPNLGYGFAVRTQNVAGTRSRFQQLDKNDRLVLKGICGLMANESFVADVVKKLESQKEFGFRDYVDNQFMKFWKKGSKAREIVSVAESCNRSVGNTGAKSVAFVSSNNSPSVTPASGSIAAVSSCNQRKLQVRLNQNVLKSLDLYTSTLDGISGPNYRKAVAGGEKLLRQWADENKRLLGGHRA